MIVASRERPSGITILAMLLITLGIIEVITGLLLGLAYASPGGSGIVATLVGVPPMFAFLLPVLAVLWMTFAIFSFIFAYAVWSRRGWSWVGSLVFTTNALTVAAFGLLIGSFANLIPIAVIALVLISLSTYNVRLYLGRIATLPPAYGIPAVPVTPPYPRPGYSPSAYTVQMAPHSVPQPPVYQSGWPMTCPACGAQSYLGANYCSSCQTRLR